MHVYVHLPYNFDADNYKHRYERGLEPDETPYGFHEARKLGCTVVFSKDRIETTISRFIRRVVNKLCGFDLVHAWRNRARINGAEVVWTMMESEWLAVQALKKLRIVKDVPVVGNSVWLFDRLKDSSRLRKRMYRSLIDLGGAFTVHSQAYLPIAKEMMPGVQFRVMHFGIATAALTPVAKTPGVTHVRPLRLFAPGNDSTRDWETLLQAFGNDPRFHLTIACKWLDESYLTKYSNLTKPPVTSIAAFRQLYRDADVVLIPMVENNYSGITVALEAAAVGVPTVSSRTGGVPTYFNEDEVLYVTPEDPVELRESVVAMTAETRDALAARAMHKFHTVDYSTLAVMRRYLAETERLLGAHATEKQAA